MHPMFDFDAATVLNKGRRTYQEDAIITDFARGCEVGLAVLADGMGGHAAGDVASKIVVSEVFSELLFQRCNLESFAQNTPALLENAAKSANMTIQEHIQAFPDTRGMGATLVATVFWHRYLFWISIGDSPLFLFRDGELTQLNEDHSMAPQIDFMATSGLLDPEEAASHPDRNILTSVLFGADIPKIDCPQEPLCLQPEDILVVASDGLQFLSDTQIRFILESHCHEASASIVENLLNEVLGLDDPDLDNVSFSVIKVGDVSAGQNTCKVADTSKSEFRFVG